MAHRPTGVTFNIPDKDYTMKDLVLATQQNRKQNPAAKLPAGGTLASLTKTREMEH